MLSESIFGLGKCPNRKTHESKSVFWLGHFASSKIESKSSFPIKYYIITIQFFLERFGLYFTKSKNGFPIVFSSLARKGSKFFFFKLGSYFFAKWLVFSY